MAEVAYEQRVMTPQKRDYEATVEQHNMLIPQEISSAPSTNPRLDREASPAESTMSSLTELSSMPPGSPSKEQTSSSGAPPAKKRKLNYLEREAEKAAKQREKEEKLKAKEEEKRLKDEQKKKAAEEKESLKRAKEIEKAEKQKAKDAEKEAKQKDKDSKKQEKDAEKAKIEAEKQKKERAQMRLGAFFMKPATQATRSATPDDVSEGVPSRRSSIASADGERPTISSRTPSKAQVSQFDKWILPFFVPEYTALAPSNRFKTNAPVDFDFKNTVDTSPAPLKTRFKKPKKRMRRIVPVKNILHNLAEASHQTIDLTNDSIVELSTIPVKHLKYQEDVRPPYCGTYTRVVSPRTTRRVSRNPYRRELPDTNYDLDSEAEWEPPAEDDEELNDEDEMSDAENDEGDMDDFLDDANDTARKKGPLIDLVPISSGICWAGEQFNDNGTNLNQYALQVLHDSTALSIDPYSTTHWADDPKPNPSLLKPSASTSSMQPPTRNPLSTLTTNTLPFARTNSTEALSKITATKPNKEVKYVDAEQLPAFRAAINGSDLTKAGLIEILKKQFPKCTKDMIKDTLEAIAVRVGKTQAEKRWQLVDGT